MSRLAPLSSRSSRKGGHFAIVASRFNGEYVDGLIAHAREELNRLSPKNGVSLYHVPGAFEIPVLVRELASQETADAILALGVILQGKTDHAKNLALSVTHALQQIAISYGIPVINSVLSVKTEKQARDRCLKSKINRGTEAARAAVEIADQMRTVRTRAK